MNLQIYYSEKLNTDVVKTSNLHSALELSKNQYSRSLKTWITDFYGFQDKVRTPIEGTDFSTLVSKTSIEGGRPTIDYEITIEFAKLITLNSRSQVKQRYAQWLLELERKLNNLEIITVEQAVFIQKMIQLFQFSFCQSFSTGLESEMTTYCKSFASNRFSKPALLINT